MKVVVTGSAGFIGSEVALRLLERGDEVVGIDNLDPYYSVELKQARLARLTPHTGFSDCRLDLADAAALQACLDAHRPSRVVHLAAQAGVQYSLENPGAYIAANLVGTGNVLEACRRVEVEHLVYASSSSVYGANETMPFSVHDNVDHPISLYAATKKANELMAHSYSHLYGMPTTGLRFFTVYGPWGRPDMSPFIFIRKILAGETIEIYNEGKHRRDFTYIDDIVDGTVLALDHAAKPNPGWSGLDPDPATSLAPYRLYNIGSNQPVELMRYIEVFEDCLGIEAEKRLLPRRSGDVVDTYADVEALVTDLGYRPKTSIEVGVPRFAAWYRDFFGV